MATPDDIPGWLVLAAEVEHLFGPMVGEPPFRAALERGIERSGALCVRAAAPGDARLAGAILCSRPGDPFSIRWLSVAGVARDRGVGTALVAGALALVRAPCTVEVDVFGVDHAGARARRFTSASASLRRSRSGGVPRAGAVSVA